ncbi:MAG: phosphatidylserine decarboxylase [Firmicutes bacterium]|nr:phosphatidylserine decarboxylase [Bacillota bacterium]
MGLNIYNRKSNKIESEKIYKSRGIDFYYKTTLGGLCRLFIRLPLISKIFGAFQKGKRSKGKIEDFIKKYDIGHCGQINNYKSFNDFFIRKQPSESIDKAARHFISPAESCVLALTIVKDDFYKIKDKSYKLSRFLKDKALAKEFDGGTCLIFRLRSYDYHRFCFVDNGAKKSVKRIRGVLDSINTGATGKFALSTNYRQTNCLKTENFGDIVVVEVGAMLVGRIVQTHTKTEFFKGEEKGYFEFGGSTVVILLKKDTIKIDDDITKYSLKNIETKVDKGERIGVKI